LRFENQAEKTQEEINHQRLNNKMEEKRSQRKRKSANIEIPTGKYYI